MEHMTSSPILHFNQNCLTASLLWDCKARLEFLTTIAIEEPDLIKNDRVFHGFVMALNDAEIMLGYAIEKYDKEERSRATVTDKVTGISE